MAGIVLFVIVSLRFFFNYTAPHGIYTVLHTLSLHDALPISRLNSTLRRLGSGWALFVEAQRVPALSYPVSDFPDVVSELVDVERREQFREEGAHFESFYYLPLLWMPPAEEAARAEAWLYEGRSKEGVDPRWEERSVGTGGVSTCRYRWAQYHTKKKITQIIHNQILWKA